MPDVPLIQIGYLNSSGEAIPPYAVVKLTSTNDVSGRQQAVKVAKPDGEGPHAIDMGQGTAATGDGAYGALCVPLTHTWWAYYTEATAPGAPWTTEIGPVAGHWDMRVDGTGYLYAGYHDATNQRILVMQKNGGDGGGKPIVAFEVTDPDCDNATALATVLAVTDGATEPAVGDHIQVCDILGCFFNTTNTLLNGRKGFAQKMKGISCHRQTTGTGTGTGTGPITTPWVVFSLCYPDVEC